MTALPMIRNAVPWKAVKILKTKKDAKFGARAVPILKPVNSAALPTETYMLMISLCYEGRSMLSAPEIKRAVC
jgi:hypothetical protein